MSRNRGESAVGRRLHAKGAQKKTGITYGYALDQESRLVDIATVTAESRKVQDYTCIACGHNMIARLGDIRRHHFAHEYENGYISIKVLKCPYALDIA